IPTRASLNTSLKEVARLRLPPILHYRPGVDRLIRLTPTVTRFGRAARLARLAALPSPLLPQPACIHLWTGSVRVSSAVRYPLSPASTRTHPGHGGGSFQPRRFSSAALNRLDPPCARSTRAG